MSDFQQTEVLTWTYRCVTNTWQSVFPPIQELVIKMRDLFTGGVRHELIGGVKPRRAEPKCNPLLANQQTFNDKQEAR